jgi:hypothetical protein
VYGKLVIFQHLRAFSRRLTPLGVPKVVQSAMRRVDLLNVGSELSVNEELAEELIEAVRDTYSHEDPRAMWAAISEALGFPRTCAMLGELRREQEKLGDAVVTCGAAVSR